MRILHTADWHMNESLGRVDRRQDVCKALEQIARYLEEYAIDVLLVAGDLMSEHSRMEELETAVGDLRQILGPFLQRGGTMVAISGNHDSEPFFEMLRQALDLVAPGRPRPDGSELTGRLYVAARPRLLKLADPAGLIVQLVLMPYPTARCYLRGEAAQYRGVEEKHRAIQVAFKHVLDELERRLDPTLPSVLVSHVHVRGVQTHSLYRLSEAEDVVFEPSDIPAHWAYVAYGHIHRPQTAIPSASHIRYAGSIERLDGNERDDEKSVVFCEIDRAGRVGEPALLPLEATPIYHLEITDPERQLPTLAQEHPDAERALVSYRLHWHPDLHDRDALCQAIQGVFPRWYRREFENLGRAEGAAHAERLGDPLTTVRAYLQDSLATHPHRGELLVLAEGLLSEEGWR